MNITQLRVIVAVADTGSITQAAERLGLTQSGASQAVSALEDGLGVRLVTRQRRGVTFTTVGDRVVAQARAALASLDAIRRLAEAAQGFERGRLRLASFPSVFSTLLPPLLQRFKTRHPGIRVTALEASDDEVEQWLAAGTVDIGVVMRRTPGRIGAPLYRDQWMAVVPAGHPLTGGNGGVALAALVAQPFVLATGGCSTHARSVAGQRGLTLADIRVEVRDWASAFALIREGMGVSLAPALHLPEDRRGLRMLPLDQPIYRDLVLEISRHATDSPAALAFLELITDSQSRAPG